MALLRLQLDPAGRALSIELRVRLNTQCLLGRTRHQMWLASWCKLTVTVKFQLQGPCMQKAPHRRLWTVCKLTRCACCHWLLQVAVQALLEAWPSDKEWRASLPALARELSQLGPNHRSAPPSICDNAADRASDSLTGFSRCQARPATMLWTRWCLRGWVPLQGSAVHILSPGACMVMLNACRLA